MNPGTTHQTWIETLLTVAVLRQFTDEERSTLIREIAGAFQPATQKAKWNEHYDGTCLHCDMQDSRQHRLLEWPVGSNTRRSFPDVMQALVTEDSPFANIPAMIVPPMAAFLQTMNFRQSLMQVPEQTCEIVRARIQAGSDSLVY